MTVNGADRRDPLRPWPLPGRPVAAGRDRVPGRRPRPGRVAVLRRQRLPRHARQPRGGPRRFRARHVHQRLPRDLADPPRRGGLRLRPRRPDDGQRPRRQADQALRRRRAAAADGGRARRTTSVPSTSAPAPSNARWSGGRPPASGCGSRSTRMVSLADRHLAVITLRGHRARRRRAGRDQLAGAQPPGRRGRVPRPADAMGGDPRKAGAVRPPGAAAAGQERRRPPAGAAASAARIADDARRRRRPPGRDRLRPHDVYPAPTTTSPDA